MTTQPDPVRLVILDLDGVVYRGDEAIEGVAGAIAAVEATGIAVRYATNNSTVDRAAYVARLAGMGIRTRREAVVTSTSATIEHLRRHRAGVRRILAVGEAGLVAELREGGYDAVPAEEAAPDGYAGGRLDTPYDAVVVGLDRALTYRRIAAAATAVRHGAAFVATNADERYPTAAGFLPGAGSAVAAIRVASGVEPIVIGKPEPAMFQAILEEAGIPASAALVVGDNPAADIVAAHRAGIRAVLVLTGVADEASARALDGERRPDVIAASAAELPRLVEPA
ncbi:MAG TPA: HAD-IIA family hydrolase [Candidatus Limnocylindria bacterium]|nr:HAD-IIA family hydrolase [Candidatus Limnocylindria bacterium]